MRCQGAVISCGRFLQVSAKREGSRTLCFLASLPPPSLLSPGGADPKIHPSRRAVTHPPFRSWIQCTPLHFGFKSGCSLATYHQQNLSRGLLLFLASSPLTSVSLFGVVPSTHRASEGSPPGNTSPEPPQGTQHRPHRQAAGAPVPSCPSAPTLADDFHHVLHPKIKKIKSPEI